MEEAVRSEHRAHGWPSGRIAGGREVGTRGRERERVRGEREGEGEREEERGRG